MPGADSAAEPAAGVEAARQAAKKLLTDQRQNLGMWAAYALLESQAGQHKVCRLHLHHIYVNNVVTLLTAPCL